MTRNQKRKIRLDKHFARQVAGNVMRSATSRMCRLCYYPTHYIGGIDRWLFIELKRRAPAFRIEDAPGQSSGIRNRSRFFIGSSESRVGRVLGRIEMNSWLIEGLCFDLGNQSVTEARQYASYMGFFHR